LQVNLSQGILLLESLPCDSIEFVNRANKDNWCVSCVCVFAFDLFIMFFMFILIPRHKSRESVKIGPHPRGHPSSEASRGRRHWRSGGGHAGAQGGHSGGCGNPPREPDRHPATNNSEVGVAGECQEEVAIVCFHGGASSLPSIGTIKSFSREFLAAEPGVGQREPL
jgi:hypothetical protein